MRKFLFQVVFLFVFSFVFAAQVEVKELAKSASSWDGNTLPGYLAGQPEITILNIKIPPRTKLDLHYHPVINAGVLLSGQLTVYTENKEKLVLNSGEAIIEVVDKWHYGVNETDEVAEILVFYAGTTSSDITVKQ